MMESPNQLQASGEHRTSGSESGSFHARPYGHSKSSVRNRSQSTRERIEDDFVLLEKPENEVEVKKTEHNYMFGFKKWKSHLTQRPFEQRSEAVKSLYEEPKRILPFIGSTIWSPGNFAYVILFGWWIALVHLFIACLMTISIFGLPYAVYCLKLSWYFLWPFGKFVKEETHYELDDEVMSQTILQTEERGMEDEEPDDVLNDIETINIITEHSLTSSTQTSSMGPRYRKVNTNIWRRPATYIWMAFGAPLLLLSYVLVIFLTGLSVVFIPISKLHVIAIKRLLLLPPEKLKISKTMSIKRGQTPREVVMCTYKAANIYYYKYTVDGMSIIITNMLMVVLITLLLGYIDTGNHISTGTTKFILGTISIIPLAYYIGMAITSISAQSRHVVGALLNATFGSFIEIFLYVSTLLKYSKHDGHCYQDIVKSALTGSLLATMLFIPGICMVIGGLKHKEQAVNIRSASVSSTLLFISVAGAYTPTVFSKVYGGHVCAHCAVANITDNMTFNSVLCSGCFPTLNTADGGNIYNKEVKPLVIFIACLLPLAYVVGLIYTLLTHAQVLEDHFREGELGEAGESNEGHEKPVVLWGRIKSIIILIVSIGAMSLCAELIVQNLEPVLESSNFSETFMGVTVIAVVPEIPEIINGIQFALKNNINLSLEVGSSVAVQVCLLQIPILIFINLKFDLHFELVFSDLHLWSVILSVIIINYIYVDGKTDYFQGCMLCIVYFILLAMFFFAPDNPNANCSI